MHTINTFDKVFNLGTIGANIIYAVPFYNPYFTTVSEVLTYFAFASPLVGIYDDTGSGYPNNLLLTLPPPTIVNGQATYAANFTLPAQAQYWMAVVIDRPTTFMGQTLSDAIKTQPNFAPVFDPVNLVGGAGIQTNYDYTSGLPGIFPSGASVIDGNGFTPFFIINQANYGTIPPVWNNYTPTITGITSPIINVARFMQNGTTCSVVLDVGGFSNATTFTVTLPFNAAQSMTGAAVTTYIDNGAMNAPGRMDTTAGSNIGTFYTVPSVGTWTATGLKGVFASFFYETA